MEELSESSQLQCSAGLFFVSGGASFAPPPPSLETTPSSRGGEGAVMIGRLQIGLVQITYLHFYACLLRKIEYNIVRRS